MAKKGMEVLFTEQNNEKKLHTLFLKSRTNNFSPINSMKSELNGDPYWMQTYGMLYREVSSNASIEFFLDFSGCERALIL